MVDLQWLIGGEAGYGIMTVGAIMSKIFTRLGLSVFDYVEYPSLIRGGHNAYYIRAADFEISSQKKTVDILIVLNKETIDKHTTELSDNAAIVYDPNVIQLQPDQFKKGILLIPVPLLEITREVGADRLMINTVSVGASLALFYNDFEVLEKIMYDIFGRKGEAVIATNINTSKAGFEHVKKNISTKFSTQIKKQEQKNIVVNGGEAIALGAIRAGVKFSAIYPMTPINTVMTTIVAKALKYNIVTKEPEDEIAGINMAIGASFAGVRSMAATSGGGFSLMTEGLGLAAQSETPLVIVEGMRPGPATGMPTWTGQGDLRFVMHAAQDDFPRIVVAPGDFLDAFSLTMQAFNLAEKYQLLVIVLVDKYLAEGRGTVEAEKFKIQNSKFKIERGKILKDEELASEIDYKRYLFTGDGVSPRSIPGQKGGIGLSGSDEHDERGLYNEEAENRVKMMDKRFKKLEMAQSDIPAPILTGDQNAPITIISFGSTKMPILEAQRWLKAQGIRINYLQVVFLNPFPSDTVSKIIKNAKKTLVIENNKTGQFEGLIREHTGLSVSDHLRKYDGRPFYPEEIVEKVKSML